MNIPEQGPPRGRLTGASVRPAPSRIVMTLVMVALAAVVIGAACAATQPPPRGNEFVLPAAVGDTLREPLVLRSVPRQVGTRTVNILDAVLDAVLDTVVLPGVTTGPMVLRAYRVVSANGVNYNVTGFPGPTLWVSPGDSVRIKLRNRMPADGHAHDCYPYPASRPDSTRSAPRDTFPNCFHGLNTTNIHYHGTHITPSGSGDNVLIEVAPGDSFQFAFRFPMNQSPGTHWYHPHKHGSVAVQVTNGMSGALIVEGGGLDSVVRAYNMKQHLIGVQQVDSTLNLIAPGLQALALVNGQLNPVIVMRQGEVQRWRFVNENVSNSTTYALLFGDAPGVNEPTIYDVARDGVAYDSLNYDGRTPDVSLIVAPGNRLDLFVKAPMDTGFHFFNRSVTGTVNAVNELSAAAAAGAPQGLLSVYVIPNDGRVNTRLPATLPSLPGFLGNLPPTPDTAAFLLFSEYQPGGRRSRSNPPTFLLGTDSAPQQKFDPTGAPFITMPLGVTQTWKVSNASAQINHPFHIHINPFQVMKVVFDAKADSANAPLYEQVNAAAARGRPLWFDTFALPKATGSTNGYIIVRQKYEDFTGRFVMHCHILGHEERGMMQLLEIARMPVPPPVKR